MIARRVMKKGNTCFVHDTRPEAVTALHAVSAASIAKLTRPHAIWRVLAVIGVASSNWDVAVWHGHVRDSLLRGVELGKVLAQRVLPELDPARETRLGHDSSTNALIERYRRQRRVDAPAIHS
ncbi:MAG: hypothetical protein ACOH2R_04595 [Pseudomonas sp.]